MRAAGFNLGGEQSGHMILSDFATTGDGLLAALQVLAVIVERAAAGERGVPRLRAAAAAAANVRFAGASPLGSPAVQAAIAEAEARLAGGGRLLIRESGTEPLIRVMAEGEDEALVRDAWSTGSARRSGRACARRRSDVASAAGPTSPAEAPLPPSCSFECTSPAGGASKRSTTAARTVRRADRPADPGEGAHAKHPPSAARASR